MVQEEIKVRMGKRGGIGEEGGWGRGRDEEEGEGMGKREKGWGRGRRDGERDAEE